MGKARRNFYTYITIIAICFLIDRLKKIGSTFYIINCQSKKNIVTTVFLFEEFCDVFVII